MMPSVGVMRLGLRMPVRRAAAWPQRVKDEIGDVGEDISGPPAGARAAPERAVRSRARASG